MITFVSLFYIAILAQTWNEFLDDHDLELRHEVRDSVGGNEAMNKG
jgi:hypothetical protein